MSTVLATLVRLCNSGALPSLDLDGDTALLEWAAETNKLLDQLSGSSNEQQPQQQHQQIDNPDKLLADFANIFASHLHIRGFDSVVSLQDLATGSNSALPKGAAQLLRHGSDVARISIMAQRLAEEVDSLQQAKLRMTEQHSQELSQQAAAYREVISGLLAQQARLERSLDEARDKSAAAAASASSGRRAVASFL